MRKKQYVRRRIITEVIKADVLVIISCFLTSLVAWACDVSHIQHVVWLYAIIIAIISIFKALECYFGRKEYEDELDKETSKEYVERRFCKSIFNTFEVSLVNPKEYSEFFYDAERKGILHFYAELADDPENVRITSRLIDGQAKEFETIRREDFLKHYRAID